MPASNVIELRSVTKIFDKGKPNEFYALRDVSLEVKAGEYLILFGPSGSGKSTLLNIVAGLDPYEKGEVLIRGERLSKKSQNELARHRREKVGMVFQQFNLLKGMSVLDNVALPDLFAGKSYKVRRNRAKELLSRLGLSKMAYRKPNELSGGQQQKVAIARALIHNPWILLVDEPTGNLDSKSAEEVMNLLKDLNQKGKRTIMLITHNPDYLDYSNRVVYMRDGKIEREKRSRSR